VFDRVVEFARRNRSGGMAANREHFEAIAQIDPRVPEELQDLLFDPQTSGGLLIALDQLQADMTLQVLEKAGVRAARIGSVGPFQTAASVIVK
jgi:selenide,water dikinase